MSHNLMDSPSTSGTPSEIREFSRRVPSFTSGDSSFKSTSRSETPAGLPTERIKKSVLACNHCRQKKTKCSSHRPSCVSCLRSNRTCVYASTPSDRAAGSREKRPEAPSVLPELDPIQGPILSSALSILSGKPRSKRRARTESQPDGPNTRQRGSYKIDDCIPSSNPHVSQWTPPDSSVPSPASQSSSEATTSLSPVLSRPLTASSSSCPSSSTMSTISIATPQCKHATCESVELPSSSTLVGFNELTYDHKAWSTTPAWLEQPPSSVMLTDPASAIYHPIPMYPSFTWPVPAAATSDILQPVTTTTTISSLAFDSFLDSYSHTPPSTAVSVTSSCTNLSSGDQSSNSSYPFQFQYEPPFPPSEYPSDNLSSSIEFREPFLPISTNSTHYDLYPEAGTLDSASLTKEETEPEMEPEWGYPHTLHSLHPSLAVHLNPPVRKRMSQLWNVQSPESLLVDPLSIWS